MSAVWIVVIVLIAAAAQSLLFTKFGLRALHYRRYFSIRSAHEGERAELIEVLSNKKPLPVPWLRVESRISPNLAFSQGDLEREIRSDQYHKSVFFLGPFSQVTRRHEIHLTKRGYYALNAAALSAGDLLALSMATNQVEARCAISVYPRLLSEDEWTPPSSRFQGDMNVKRFIQPDPFLVAGIRDYRIGDPVRDIHWLKTASTGQIQVKVRDYTADPRIMVILNVQLSEEQWGELMEDEQEVIEQGLRIAATLCMRALQSGVEAGFACNGCLQGEKSLKRPIIIPSKKSEDQAELLLETMARVVIHREITFPTFLGELSGLTGEDILILSAYESDALLAQMADLRARGNSVALYPLRGGDEDA